ncbi:hypothetical protein CHUAL_004628 [Chamberlinius hualienensis]
MKMFCWEELYCKSIEEIRKKEMKLTFLKSCIKSAIFVFYTLTSRISLYITVTLMIYMNHSINASDVYMSSAIFGITQITLVIMLAKLVECLAYALVSFERIQNILDMSEIDNKSINIELGSTKLIDVTSSWHPYAISNEKPTAFTFRSINVVFPCSAITMVTGPVGSGKSSLLMTLANELHVYSGKVFIGGISTYMPQEPWLFPSTVRQNILFGLPFDEQKYQHILESCALDHDLVQFPNGDSSNVDDKGLILSGGQKARIALARKLLKLNCCYYCN